MTTTGKQTQRAAQERRLQAALKENLRRRKAQARGRQVATETEDAPIRPRRRNRIGNRCPRNRINRKDGPKRPTFAAIEPACSVISSMRRRSWGDMDRIRIVGGPPLNGRIPISGAKNAALPLMIASLLTDQTLILDNVPRLADVVLLQRILGNHGVDVMIERQAPGRGRVQGPDAAPLGRAHRRHHGALRARLQDAGELLGDRAAGRPHGRGARLDAGRLRHRHPPGRPPDHGAGAARRADRDRRRLRDCARAEAASRAARSAFPRSRSAAPTRR